MRYSVNTQCLYPGVPLDRAFAALKQKGFAYVEDWVIPRQEAAERAALLEKYGLRLTAFCPAFFILNDPARHDEYERHLSAALEDAARMGAPALITQVGGDTGAPREAQHEALVTGLRRMAPLLKSANATLLVEPLNDVKDHPGYYLTHSGEGFDLIREVDSPHVRLLFDVYHQVHMGEDVLNQIRNNIDLIGHFHIAAHPNRDERLFEVFDYAPVLQLIRSLGTDAPVGIELFPSSADAVPPLLDKLLSFL